MEAIFEGKLNQNPDRKADTEWWGINRSHLVMFIYIRFVRFVVFLKLRSYYIDLTSVANCSYIVKTYD